MSFVSFNKQINDSMKQLWQYSRYNQAESCRKVKFLAAAEIYLAVGLPQLKQIGMKSDFPWSNASCLWFALCGAPFLSGGYKHVLSHNLHKSMTGLCCPVARTWNSSPYSPHGTKYHICHTERHYQGANELYLNKYHMQRHWLAGQGLVKVLYSPLIIANHASISISFQQWCCT